VNGSADVVAVQGCHVQRLGENALTCEGSIAVDDNWQNLIASAFADALLLGARASEDNGIDCFEVAGIGGEVD
jgi:hypothetical protein